MNCTNVVEGKVCGGAIEGDFCSVCFADYSNEPVAFADGSIPVPTASQSVSIAQHSSTLRSRRGSVRLGTGQVFAEVLGLQSVRRARDVSLSVSSSRRRGGIGGTLVVIDDVPSTDPITLIRAKHVDEALAVRMCTNPQHEPISLVRLKSDGTYFDKGVCTQCGTPFDFRNLEPMPILPGELVAGQYEVKGVIAKGGNGFVYLADDRDVVQWTVMKTQIRKSDADAKTSQDEKRMLANLRDPSIVSILGFKTHRGVPVIITEWLNGKTVEQMHKDNGGPLPVAQSVALVLAMCESMNFLHSQNPPVINPDIKPGNFMVVTGNRMVQIDAGGWLLVTDTESNVTATTGYAPREVDDESVECTPSPLSDQYSLGRIAAVLANNFDFAGAYRYSLPDLATFTHYPSYGEWVKRACAADPANRFASVAEFQAQGWGVLHEIVAIDKGVSSPWQSALFDGDITGGLQELSFRLLPSLRVYELDPGRSEIETILKSTNNPQEAKDGLERVVLNQPKSREARLRVVESLTDTREFAEAELRLGELEKQDPEDWRNAWYHGRLYLATGNYTKALECFGALVSMLPGEPAVKLALGIASELAGDDVRAITAYDLVTLVAPQFTSAAFGLARCLTREGSRESAVKALERVPSSSFAYGAAQLEIAWALCASHSSTLVGKEDLLHASKALHNVVQDTVEWHTTYARVLETALDAVLQRRIQPDETTQLISVPLIEKQLRLGLEHELQQLARLTPDVYKRIQLMEQAHLIRPRTWF